MKYVHHIDFMPSIRTLFQCGGKYQAAAKEVQMVLGRTTLGEKDIFIGLKLTNHGENRIKHCIKYDLTGFSRLIIIQDNGFCAFCFVGNHNDCDNWLDRNSGIRLTVDADNVLSPVFISTDITIPKARIACQTDLSIGKLFEKLPKRYYERIASDIDPSVKRSFEELESINNEDEILSLSLKIKETSQSEAFFDVFCMLRSGDVLNAKKRIDLYTNDRLLLTEIKEERIEKVVSGDEFVDSETFTELFEHFITTADYRDWMLFMGRDQREIVSKEYSGPAKLTGVSGSGKTCIIINRAIRLAKKYEGEKILILTLNRSLSKLIENLVEYACPTQTRQQISVLSFWELCQEQLKVFEPNDFEKLYTDITWKHGEHISEVWDEFYDIWKQREFNNTDVHNHLVEVHKALVSRGVFPKDYINQEFDWIRSAFPISERSTYLEVERKGRAIPLTRDLREFLLKGLECWETKMQWIGVTDYLGLAVALHKHIKEIKPQYRCILLDEAQDFGTIELQIARSLVSENENDIFLTGDVAQRVYTKHHKVKSAGIDYTGRTSSIRRNYRNSREILSAAYNVLTKNNSLDMFKDEDFEILDPEYANYSTPKPLVLKASSLEEELARCYNYLRNKFKEENKKKACIAIAGFSLLELKQISEKLVIPLLDGTKEFAEGTIFISDLEQTKGYEFDTVCILNCNNGIIPNPVLPKDEWYRELSKFYVAMTRAKQELIISYSSNLTDYIRRSREHFVFARWDEHEECGVIENIEISFDESILHQTSVLDMSGVDFLYTKMAIGCSLSLQQKVLEKVAGKNSYLDGKRIGWRTLRDLLEVSSPRDRVTAARAFGETEYDELHQRLSDLIVKHSVSNI